MISINDIKRTYHVTICKAKILDLETEKVAESYVILEAWYRNKSAMTTKLKNKLEAENKKLISLISSEKATKTFIMTNEHFREKADFMALEPWSNKKSKGE